MDMIPATAILPPKGRPRREICRPCRVPTQRERRLECETYGLYSSETIYATWRDADLENGDLLYIGATAKLINRLHPHSHFMWSTVWHRRIRTRVRIAVWAMPDEHMGDVESWMTQMYAPLWSNARGRSARGWILRAPDRVLSTDAFYPYHRKVLPFHVDTGGVYAWLLAPESAQGDSWIAPLLQNSKRRRAIKDARPIRHIPRSWSCDCHPWLFNHHSVRTCVHCGLSREEAKRAAQRKLSEALSWAGL